MTNKKLRNRLARALRRTGAPFVVAHRAAKIAVRVGVSSANPLASFGAMVGIGPIGNTLSAMGFGVEGLYMPCCSDPSDGEVFEPRGVFYSPGSCQEELPLADGGRVFRPVYPEGAYSVPV